MKSIKMIILAILAVIFIFPDMVESLAFQQTSSIVVNYNERVESVNWSPDGQYIAVGVFGFFSIIDATQFKEIKKFTEHPSSSWFVAWSPNGKYFAAASTSELTAENRLHLFRVVDFQTFQNFYTIETYRFGMSWSGDSENIAWIEDDGVVGFRINDETTYQIYADASPYFGGVELGWSIDDISISGVFEDTLWTWNSFSNSANTIPLVSETDDHRVLVFSPNGEKMATVDASYLLNIWDTQTGELIHVFEDIPGTEENYKLAPGMPWAVAWSPDGTLLVVGFGGDFGGENFGDNSIRIYDALRFQELEQFRDHSLGITDLAWSPDGLRFASTSYDGTLRIWNIEPLTH
jgi:WD40 repeat protein